ncbi:hypothetical protein VKI21_10255 [Cyanobacterium aponinum UTEX 3222]|nr:hypothetical protein [Cyanobacterium aponinum]WRL40455.1 hypothetical protein VKI21_10255 [Cyanobacterium aponinum UTEX 3222]MBD2393161.1 hypothetical protein [Cyanobacterium aponinum FACHB-4101]MTF37471.1 hypothetical protein [Cyanobacterium aponinum 0216]PHV62361.1 hypothetical protein CSQ80_10945 [Cyanobacterium aponinum IPPAS B-1201]WPF87309.1 hypothetical protein SAY89_10875 [Cyanobacterium aponinum AL20115]
MNLKMMLFSGIMTALIGLMLGLAVSEISQRVHRRNIVIIGGGVLGFVLGFTYQGIKQEKDERQKEYEDTK